MSESKSSYQSPEIVDAGTVVEKTTGSDKPVRDAGSNPMTYYNSAKHQPLPLDGPDPEVDLGGR